MEFYRIVNLENLMTKGYLKFMDTDIFVLAGLLVVLSVVQSYFGVGLLIFGTPSFLLLCAKLALSTFERTTSLK